MRHYTVTGYGYRKIRIMTSIAAESEEDIPAILMREGRVGRVDSIETLDIRDITDRVLQWQREWEAEEAAQLEAGDADGEILVDDL